MDLISVILFLAMYYLRPHEWPGPFSSLHPVQLTMIMGLAALASREKQVRLKDLVQTPHDYALIFFFAWLCFTSGSPYSNFKSIANLIVFYGVIVQTLNSVRRMEIFLTWWCVFILAVSLLAVASESGFDPFGSYQLTHWFMKDRLTLNLSIFNNPNALAHSVVPVIPMLYFLLLWKRPLLIKKLALLTLVPPLYCIYLTVSKGAFISGFATLIVTLIFGRPKYVQIAILTAAIVLGTGALYALPRMTELNKSKSDEAIQGRIAAYTYGYKCVTTMWAGIGYNNWMWGFYNQSRRYKIVKEPRMVNHVLTVRPRLVPERYAKAAHGSFNNMGAELGFTGLALFFGMVWCSIRTLTTCKVSDVEEERVRRILFVLMVSYLVSSWMVDFGYRPTFFMFTAATAAFHRHLRGIHRQIEAEYASEKEESTPWWIKKQAQLASTPDPIAAGGVIPAPALETASLATLTPAVAASAALPAPPALVIPKEATRTSASSRWRTALKKRSEPSYPSWWPKTQSESPIPLKSRPIFKLRPVEEEPIPAGYIRWNKIGWVDAFMAFILTCVVLRIWARVIHTM